MLLLQSRFRFLCRFCPSPSQACCVFGRARLKSIEQPCGATWCPIHDVLTRSHFFTALSIENRTSCANLPLDREMSALQRSSASCYALKMILLKSMHMPSGVAQDRPSSQLLKVLVACEFDLLDAKWGGEVQEVFPANFRAKHSVRYATDCREVFFCFPDLLSCHLRLCSRIGSWGFFSRVLVSVCAARQKISPERSARIEIGRYMSCSMCVALLQRRRTAQSGRVSEHWWTCRCLPASLYWPRSPTLPPRSSLVRRDTP